MKKNIFIMLILLFCVSTLQAQAQSKSKKLDSLFNLLHKAKKFNGNVLIAEKGAIIYQNSFGLANEETKEMLNANSIFELASVSKQFTAMGIVILKEKGKLNYDDEIGKHIPELKFYKVTVRHLLNHTNGLPDYMQLLDSLLIDSTWKNKTKIATNKDIISVFAKHKPKLLFEPNTKWEYSNTGYALLATIIENVSKQKYADFLKKSIFEPLKMKNTFVYTRRLAPKKVPNYAFGYIHSRNNEVNILPDKVPEVDMMVFTLDGIVGDGTVNSTTNDLFIWDRALYKNTLISAESIVDVFSSGILADKKTTNYGFGWGLENEKLFGKITQHGGGWPGYETYIERHLDNDKTIIFLQNNNNSKTVNPKKQVRDILYGIIPPKPVEISLEILKIYSGLYITSRGNERALILEDKALYFVINPQTRFKLVPITQTKFTLEDFLPEVIVDFYLENGKVVKYTSTQEGVIKESKRKP